MPPRSSPLRPAGDRTVVLYAPTFRGESVVSASYDDFLDLERMAASLADDHIVLMRLHPFVRDRLRIPPELAGFALDVSDHPDINELMLVSDLLVTDYSSAIYEFSLLGRPICFLAPDHLPTRASAASTSTTCPVCRGRSSRRRTNWSAHLREGPFDLARVAAFRRANFDVADGHASARVVDRILLPALRARDPGPPC